MKEDIVIKSTKNGLILRLPATLPFDELCEKLKKKFASAAGFFGSAEMVIKLEGREVSSNDIDEIYDIISDSSSINIIAVFDNTEADNKIFEELLDQKVKMLADKAARIYVGSVKSGEEISFDESVIISGNVEENAKVHSNGSIFVLGDVKGSLYAGELGNKSSLVFASHVSECDIAIADHFYVFKQTEEKGLFKKKKNIKPELSGALFCLKEGEVVLENV